MSPERFREITARFDNLRVVLVGDFCLDRYFDIDPALAETSIETGLPVHNIAGVRCLPGAAGTILANLVALGAGSVRCVGIRGEDGEGHELDRALRRLRGVELSGFVVAPGRNTFTYTKPLLHHPGRPPEELSRLDLKNFTPTPADAEAQVLRALEMAGDADAWIVLDQVDLAGTGVVTPAVLEQLGRIASSRPSTPMLADSRRGLAGWPSMLWKMNAAELGRLTGTPAVDIDDVRGAAEALAGRNGRPVFVTLAERGIVGALPDRPAQHVPAFPVRGPLDIVGAGDSVSATLALASASGAGLREAMLLAMAAASIVIHQVGTTGAADRGRIAGLMFP